MKKNYCYIALSLLLSLFVYLFYRTEKTVINEIFISIISFDKFAELRKEITNILPLNEHIIYSLPEGLWVFCITLTSKHLFLKVGKLEINLFFIPLVFSIGLELFQLLHLTNGRFDFWDIGFSILFWAVANYLINYKSIRQNILQPFTLKSFICLLSYLIVYLAHVWK
ncbi:MAG: hypothetical protein QM541_04190 [Flavobacterium sp.]|nr:hypothetical protein [Flavobacterium sp.]